jgi:A/G-specific adenine glycosylase
MLQQTQVATVIDYYDRFLAIFPTVADLADADEAVLMRLWEGLGYYRRARLMHKAAKQLVELHGGNFPTDLASVLELPGIGRYTANAILSISRDARLPILEGNTVRVFSRWVALRDDVKSAAGNKKLWEIAAAMLPKCKSGQFNQAAMELGALICKPVSPRCEHCPVADHCEAFRLGLHESIPGKVTKTVYEARLEFAFVIPNTKRNAWLICRVPDGKRWAGLWDFPRATDGTAKTVEKAAATISRTIGVTASPIRLLATIRHAVTRYRITLQVHETSVIEIDDLGLAESEFRFATIDELGLLPLSVTARKIVKLLGEANF